MRAHDGANIQLRDRTWAMQALNYQPHQRSAFWQFVYSHSVPHVRVSSRRILFNEVAVRDWLEQRSIVSGAK